MSGLKKKCLLCLSLIFVMGLMTGCKGEEPEKTVWQPEGQWAYTPMLLDVDTKEYDIELSLDKESYPQDIDEIVCNIVNKTGASFQFYGVPMIEKCFTGDQWARLPYQISNPLARQYFSTVGNTDSIRFYTEFLQEGVSLTPGEYRLVVFFPDGPQYAYFEITA